MFPAYYEDYLKRQYPDAYFDLPAAFQCVDQAADFPAMSKLLFEIENYRGEGVAAALFYEAKVTEAIALVVDNQRKQAAKGVVTMRECKDFWDRNAGLYDYFMRKDGTAYEMMYEMIRPVVKAKTVLKDDGMLIAPTFTHAGNSFSGKVKAFFMKLAGFPLHSRWTSEAYLNFLRQNGWTVRKRTVLKASFPLTYAECVKAEV